MCAFASPRRRRAWLSSSRGRIVPAQFGLRTAGIGTAKNMFGSTAATSIPAPVLCGSMATGRMIATVGTGLKAIGDGFDCFYKFLKSVNASFRREGLCLCRGFFNFKRIAHRDKLYFPATIRGHSDTDVLANDG